MRRVLRVERSLVEHEGLADRLRADGLEVTEVTGKQALSHMVQLLMMADEPPVLIIADAEESGGPGLDAMIAAHHALGDPPLILLTDTVDTDLRREADLLDAKYVFFPPCEVEALRSASRVLSVGAP